MFVFLFGRISSVREERNCRADQDALSQPTMRMICEWRFIEEMVFYKNKIERQENIHNQRNGNLN